MKNWHLTDIFQTFRGKYFDSNFGKATSERQELKTPSINDCFPGKQINANTYQKEEWKLTTGGHGSNVSIEAKSRPL